MGNRISFLLGAGFSAPMGYPIGNELNEKLLKCNEEPFSFHTSGTLAVRIDGKKPEFGYKNYYDLAFEFCFQLMHYYKDIKGHFDYEEFYDYIIDEVSQDKNVKDIAKPFETDSFDISSLISKLSDIYTQIVSYFLKDKYGKSHYDNLPYFIGSRFDGYSGIMNYISKLSEDNILDIHTLNHDLFFESFNNTDFLKGNLCDGFEELGSSYYGNIDCNNRKYLVRLERYTGVYNSNIRLYKLHGSLNYEAFYKSSGQIMTPDTYIKTRYGVGHTDHYKEITNEQGELEYENSWVNYHPDFLTGTTSKIARYSEPLLFEKLFKLFKTNLQNSDKLIIIGYGAKDEEINKIILENFDCKNKDVYIIDPYAGDNVLKFAEQTSAKVIKKELENIMDDDFE